MFVTYNLFILALTPSIYGSFSIRKAELIKQDESSAIGASLKLNDKEKAANEVLMKYKLAEIDEGLKTGDFFPTKIFPKAKTYIDKSEVFKIIKMLPKGASLHAHDSAMLSPESLFDLTVKFSENLHVRVSDDGLELKYFNESTDATSKWRSIQNLRRRNSSFDAYLKKELALSEDQILEVYKTNRNIWQTFDRVFKKAEHMRRYVPVFKEYIYKILKEFYDDNVVYLEIRSSLKSLYDLNDTIFTENGVMTFYSQTIEQFKADYPDFHGARIIYAPHRYIDKKAMSNAVQTFFEIKNNFGNYVAGFDIVGSEDTGNTLDYYHDQLKTLAQHKTKFFFHAGETKWQGAKADLNLVDAIMFNSTRIGHGYGIIKHPKLLKIVQRHKIPIEICPLSNQLLHLIHDLRNHPGAYLIAMGHPVVIGSDDPAFWGAKGLSYDWYVTFMTMTSRNSDLRFLKQLAINSIKFSAMEETERNRLLAKWTIQWEKFIDKIK